jgi:transposase
MGCKNMKNRKKSKYSGKKYKRYRKGFWSRYKGQRRWKYHRVILEMKRLLNNTSDPYQVRPLHTVGRPPANPKDILIFLMFKQLFCLSYLDTESFLLWVYDEKTWLMETVPDANTAQEHISDIPLSYLETMMKDTIRCLSENNVTVIIDATGLSLSQYGRWITVRNGKKKTKKKFVKIHLAVDKASGKILVGICSKGWKHEHKFGIQIVKSLRRSCKKQGITIETELLDSGYLSREMTDEIERSKAKPYIKMKKNSTTRSGRKPSWKRNIRLQKDHPEKFMKEYCYRVVIEGIISALKQMFGSMISSKKRYHQNVEVLCRLVLWNCMH